MISFTLFKNIYDNNTSRRVDFSSFDQFDMALESLSKKAGYKPKKGEKLWQSKTKSTELISPALYSSGTTRANANVLEFGGFAMMDIDEHDFGNGDNLEYELCTTYSDTKFICYSTASSTYEKPKFRLLFPLTRWIKRDEILKLIYGIKHKFGDMADPQTSDVSRMFYLPAQYPEAYSFYFSHGGNGKYLDVDSLFEEYPYTGTGRIGGGGNFLDRLDSDLKNYIMQHRTNRVMTSSRRVQWSSYIDCPFVNKGLIREYQGIAHIDGTGRYRMIFKIMCSIAKSALEQNYPILEGEIVSLIRQLDADTANLYQKRNLNVEAGRALAWAYQNL